jgi:hypothetical protein
VAIGTPYFFFLHGEMNMPRNPENGQQKRKGPIRAINHQGF